MESLKEFFAAVRERLSSPLIGSFVIAWSIANWPLFVGLAFLDEKGYEHFKTANAVDFVANYLKTDVRWFWPLIAAITYSFGYPFVKAVIRAVRDHAEVISEKWNLRIVKNSKVDTEKFLRLRDSYLAKEKSLQSLIDEEDSIRVSLNQTTARLQLQTMKNLELSQNIESLKGEHSKITQQLESFIDGLRNYSFFEIVENLTFREMNSSGKILGGYYLSFSRSRDLKPILLLKYEKDSQSHLYWFIDEICTDPFKKSSIFHCKSRFMVEKTGLDTVPKKRAGVLPDQFFWLVKESNTGPGNIRIVFQDRSEGYEFVPA